MSPKRFRASGYYKTPILKVGGSMAWSPSYMNGGTLPDAQPFALELSSGVETKLGRNLMNSVARAVRGHIWTQIAPTAADSRTRYFWSAGIRWADDDGTSWNAAAAGNSSPQDDNYRWMWRDHGLFDGLTGPASTQSNPAGTSFAPNQNWIAVNLKVTRKQPTPMHKLGLFIEYSDTNIGSTNVSTVSATAVINTLIRQP